MIDTTPLPAVDNSRISKGWHPLLRIDAHSSVVPEEIHLMAGAAALTLAKGAPVRARTPGPARLPVRERSRAATTAARMKALGDLAANLVAPESPEELRDAVRDLFVRTLPFERLSITFRDEVEGAFATWAAGQAGSWTRQGDQPLSHTVGERSCGRVRALPLLERGHAGVGGGAPRPLSEIGVALRDGERVLGEIVLHGDASDLHAGEVSHFVQTAASLVSQGVRHLGSASRMALADEPTGAVDGAAHGGRGADHAGDPVLAYRSLLREISSECVRLEDERALELVLRATVPAFAECAYVVETPSSGEAPQLLLAHVDPVREEQLRDADAGAGFAAAVLALVDRSMKGEAVLLRELTDAMLRPYIADPAQRSTFRGLGLRSAVVVPLALESPARGAIVLAREASRGSFGSEDLEKLGEIARQASLARDRERLQRDALSIAHTRDAVLAAISHDLRNPLNVIRMGTDALLRHHAPTPEGELERKQLEVMQHAVGHMSRLVRDLLDTSRIDAGCLCLEPVVCQAHDPVAAALEIMGPVAAERSVRILDEIPADLPPVLVDGDRIVQVFSNLIGNAIRFTPEGGHITLRASAEAGEVRYSVVDHGPGIPDELRPHLFSRIWQVKRRARGGMGLGLRIARGIVEAHGGRIWVESVQGQGSTFHFTVPTVTAAPEGEAPHAQGAWEADSWGWMIKEEAVEEAAVGIAVRPTLTRTARSGGAAW